jgi:glutamate-ammonia-ligase adenylyltransferase
LETSTQKYWLGNEVLPRAGDPQAVENGLRRWVDAAARGNDEELVRFVQSAVEDARWGGLFGAVFGNSPFLSQCVIVDPGHFRMLLEHGPDEAFRAILATVADKALITVGIDAIMQALRQLRRRAALTVAVADVTGTWTDEEVTEALSRFAISALRAAVAVLLREGHDAGNLSLPHPDEPELNCGFIVLGMGKLSAGELNYSSDIDLILLFDDDVAPYTGAQSAQEYFVRLARQLCRVLEDRTGDGYVFRTDLRLRPDPGSTPPVISVMAAETYYESIGQNWERAAMIKARPVAGDIAAGERFLEILRPFIWRRSLDFAAIEDIHSIKRQINAHRGGNRIAVAGHNVKLGRGGIREIEFFAQTQQLIWGGRDATLRQRRTSDALRALVAAGHVEAATADALIEDYWFLRRVEHRLQMIDDQQTHELPTDETKLNAFAAFMGMERDSPNGLDERIRGTLHRVEDIYGRLFEESPELGGTGTLVFTGGEDHPDTLKTLQSWGFRDPAAASGVIRNWHHGRFPATRSTRARELLTELMPGLLGAFSKTLNPDAALLGFNDFLAGLPAGVQLFSLFHSNPALLELLAEIMGSAPRLAETLKRHPILFDAVLESDFFDAVPGADQLAKEVSRALQYKARDFQDVLDIVRRQANDRMFQVGVHILRGRTTPENSGIALSYIADTALRTLYAPVEQEFAEAHGRIPGGEMGVIALGKLGGQELTISSDLDLLFIYRGDEEESDGKRPLAPIPYFTRLGQRYLSALTAPTAEGILYEVDMRLRPSGNSGPLSSSYESFLKYHRESAWTWEHMALTRARIVLASDHFRDDLEYVIRSILTAPRESDTLLRDVASMRARIERDRKSGGDWDVKNRRGGLVDIEFIAQYLQLRYGAAHPEILSPNTTDALLRLKHAGILDPGMSESLVKAMHLWRNVQGVLRLSVGDDFDEASASSDTRAMLARGCKMEDYETLKQTVSENAARCYEIFCKLIEGPAAKMEPRET